MLGIEAVGVVDAAPGSDLQVGQQVATLLGGMGRTFDGGYARFTVVPRRQHVRVRDDEVVRLLSELPRAEPFQRSRGLLRPSRRIKVRLADALMKVGQ